MAIAIVSILMIIVGIIIYLWSGTGREIGRACFWSGFIGLALAYAHKTAKAGSVAIALVPVLMIVIGIIGYLWSTKPEHANGREIFRGCFWGGFIGIAVAYATTMIRFG